MQPITVAIADDDGGRRARYEHTLQGEQGIQVLADAVTCAGDMSSNRRLSPRSNMTAIENVVARIRRLKPRILFADLKQCTDEDCAMLVSLRRECPETLVVVLADESVQQEDRVMQALATGARGYMDIEADVMHVAKAVQVIDRGEAWVPRQMLGKVMDQVMHWCHTSSIEANLDPAC